MVTLPSGRPAAACAARGVGCARPMTQTTQTASALRTFMTDSTYACFPAAGDYQGCQVDRKRENGAIDRVVMPPGHAPSAESLVQPRFALPQSLDGGAVLLGRDSALARAGGG